MPSFNYNDSLIAYFLGSLALSGTAPEIHEAVNSLKRLGLITIERTDPLVVFTLSQKGNDAGKGLHRGRGLWFESPTKGYAVAPIKPFFGGFARKLFSCV